MVLLSRNPVQRLLLAAVTLTLLAGCADTSRSGPAPVRFADVHGMAVDPSNPSVLYVATHHGLFKGVRDKDWSRVGQEVMDLMGFTMHPNGTTFYASGHPGNPNRDYSSLGVIKSTDGGVTWTTIALKNQVDFHAMGISLARPETVWGYYYRDQHFYESTDGGATWNNFAPTVAAPGINSIAGHAANSKTVFAGTNQGVWVSRDAGKNWAVLVGAQPSGAAGAVTTTRADPLLLWAYFPSAGLARTEDGGATWSSAAPIQLGSNDQVAVVAIDPSSPTTVYVASGRGAVFRSTDEGATWVQVQEASS